MTHDENQQRLEDRALAPLTGFSQTWFIWTGVLIALCLLGFIAYGYQVRDGLAVTGMGDDVIWGVWELVPGD